MAKNEPAGVTPAVVAQHATQTDALNPSRLTLLGIFGPNDDLRALVRLPGGKVRTLAPGQRFGRSKIVGIDAAGLMVVKNGQTRRISMPGG